MGMEAKGKEDRGKGAIEIGGIAMGAETSETWDQRTKVIGGASLSICREVSFEGHSIR